MTPPFHDDQQDTVRVDRTELSDIGHGANAQRARQSRTVGGMLRAEREGLGLELEQVANQLRIRYPYLVAIEAGEYGALPGPTYVVGFVRTYAEYLGLDPQDVIARFRQEVSGLDARPDLAFPVPVTRRSVPGGAILVTALILAVCGYGTWYYLSTSQRPRQEQVAAVPSRLLDLMPEAAKSPNEPPGQNEAAAPPLTPPTPIAAPSAPPAASPAAGARAAASGPVTAAAPTPGTLAMGTPTTTTQTASLPPGRLPAPALAAGATTASASSQPTAGAPAVSVLSGPAAQPAAPATPTAQPAATTATTASAAAAPAPHELTQAQLNQAQLDLLNRNGRPAALPTQLATAPAAPGFGGMQQSPSSQPAFQTPASADSSATTQSLNEQQLTRASNRPIPAAASAAPAGDGGSGRITIHASADSWVQLKDGNQHVFVARMLKAGETLRVPEQSGMTLRTGNAGGLDIAVDGRPVQSIGASGVVRSVTLEPQKLMSGDAGQE